jgi:hypothetical protein
MEQYSNALAGRSNAGMRGAPGKACVSHQEATLRKFCVVLAIIAATNQLSDSILCTALNLPQ